MCCVGSGTNHGFLHCVTVPPQSSHCARHQLTLAAPEKHGQINLFVTAARPVSTAADASVLVRHGSVPPAAGHPVSAAGGSSARRRLGLPLIYERRLGGALRFADRRRPWPRYSRWRIGGKSSTPDMRRPDAAAPPAVRLARLAWPRGRRRLPELWRPLPDDDVAGRAPASRCRHAGLRLRLAVAPRSPR